VRHAQKPLRSTDRPATTPPMNRTRPSKNALVVLGLVALLGACAPTTRVTLLPQADGTPSAVEISTSRSTQSISQPYQVAGVYGGGVIVVETTTADQVRRSHPELLALKPPPHEFFTLEFQAGTTQLAAESQAQLGTVIHRAQARAGGEILITGHADRQGSAEANMRLSVQRAQALRTQLIERGFKAELIEAVGRGEREPVVPTDDDVAEPRNRRADVIVR
jgi:OmpA-OmpF porin, OOP family